MKVQLLVVAVLILFDFDLGNAQSAGCLAASQASLAAQDTCFGGNATTFGILLGQLSAAAGDFENGAAMIMADQSVYEPILDQFCNQTCINIFANYFKECIIPSVDTANATIVSTYTVLHI